MSNVLNRENRKLVWKYFWQQKKEEVVNFFEDNWRVFASVMVFFGLTFQMWWQINPNTGESVCKTAAIIGLCMVGFWVIIGLIALIKVICKWLKNNWEEAEERVMQELEERKK